MRWVPLLLVLTGCVATARPWSVEGASWPGVQTLVQRAIEVTGDKRGHLRNGGVIVVIEDQASLNARCGFVWNRPASACSTPGEIVVLHRLAMSVLPHELCHLGLVRWVGGPFGGVRMPSEAECDACAAEFKAGGWPWSVELPLRFSAP